MTTIQVFDPPMCCSSGVCGPAVDPTLVRFASDLNWLVKHGVHVDRFNLAQQPHAFAANAAVKAALQSEGNACLPLILIDGAVASRGTYPVRQQLAGWVGLADRIADEAGADRNSASLPVIQG